MGAWGTGSFDNDDAQDWLWDLEGDLTWGIVERTFHDLIDADYREVDLCGRALAAAEVVAGAAGKPCQVFVDQPQHLKGRSEPSETQKSLARRAVALVRDDSEMLDLWKESESFGAWKTAIAELQGRLG